MITRKEQREAQRRAAAEFRRIGFAISERECENIEVVDFGLGRLEIEGVQILTLVHTGRISVKLLCLFPDQTEPEHWHPPVGDDPGKEETVRLLDGTLRFYVEGEDTLSLGAIPAVSAAYYRLRHEIVMKPGDQLLCKPGQKHWFQAGRSGAILFSFSSVARDETDCFANPGITRATKIADG